MFEKNQDAWKSTQAPKSAYNVRIHAAQASTAMDSVSANMILRDQTKKPECVNLAIFPAVFHARGIRT